MLKWLQATLISVLGILAPTKPLLLVVGVLIAADTITGVWAAIKRSEKITSNRFFRLPMKMLLFHLTIITAFLVETYLLEGLIPVSRIAATAIGLTEFYSMIENVESITGKSIFQDLLAKLGKKA